MTSLHLQQYTFLSPPLTKLPTSILFTNSKPSPSKLSFSLNASNAEPSRPTSQDPTETSPEAADRVKLAFERAQAYKKALEEKKSAKVDVGPGGGAVEEEEEVPDAVKVAMERAKEYKKNKGVNGGGGGVEGLAVEEPKSGMREKKDEKSGSNVIGESAKIPVDPPLSSIDFIGLDFEEKKSRKRLPAGLLPVTDSFPDDDMPEVEIIVGDTSKFGDTSTSTPKLDEDDNSDLYKPKVSTWGVFPRPANISKTFGGGRNIRPGEALETAAERAAKEKRTRELLAAYKKKIGMVVDPKVKSECQKALMNGDSLMESGKLREALPYYEEVMDKLPFQTELHGLAALQWSICQDSLSRRDEARRVYEKLQSHPNAEVSKKASLFVFSFQAMKMMKVTGSNFLPAEGTGYDKFFDDYIKNKTIDPIVDSERQEGQDNELGQALPYMIFLVSPILFVLLLSLQRGNVH